MTDGGVAVIIASSPCVLSGESGAAGTAQAVRVTEDCTGCRACLDMFECPALVWDEARGGSASVAPPVTGCGVCLHVCPTGAIVADGGEAR